MPSEIVARAAEVRPDAADLQNDAFLRLLRERHSRLVARGEQKCVAEMPAAHTAPALELDLVGPGGTLGERVVRLATLLGVWAQEGLCPGEDCFAALRLAQMELGDSGGGEVAFGAPGV